MEQKAEELYKDGWAHPRPQFSVDERAGVYVFKVYRNR